MDQRYEALLRRLAVLDEQTIAAALHMQAGDDRGLDARTTALVRLAGLVALQSSPQTYEWAVAAALDTGCSAAVNVATAIGCHVDVAGWD